MKIPLIISLIFILFSGCAPKISTQPIIKDTKIQKELIKDLNEFSSENIKLKTNWWEKFDDKQLNTLIINALKNAPTLKALEAIYLKANNIIKSIKSNNLPKISIDSNASRQRFSENYTYPKPYKGNYYNSYKTGLNIDYNFDFYNSRNSVIKATMNEALSQKVLIKEKELFISTTIAKLYISWNFRLEKLKKLSSIKKIYFEKNILLNNIYNLGLSNKTNINKNNALIENINQKIFNTKYEIVNIKNSIAIITGLLPSQIEKLDNPNIKQTYKVYVPLDIHLDIISHRPEIAIQKYLLLSKNDYIQNAKSMYYPNISLKSLFGFTSFPFSKLFDKSSFSPKSEVAFSLPIFNTKEIDANLNMKINEYNEQVYNYNDSVIKAVNEIINSLKKLTLAKSNLISENIILNNKNKNIKIEKNIYNLGLKNKISYLDSKANFKEEELNKLTLLNNEYNVQIELIKALGGGYIQKVDNVSNN